MGRKSYEPLSKEVRNIWTLLALGKISDEELT
jgi:hypothetical protein